MTPPANRQRPSRGNALLYLVVGIPVAALLMGIVTLFVAFSNPDPGVVRDAVPLSKTSWSDSDRPAPQGRDRP